MDEMTEQQAKWAKAFVEAQAEMPDVPKDKKATIPTKSGGSYEYTYSDLASVVKLVRPVLAKHGLGTAQDVIVDEGSVSVSTLVIHEAGHIERFGPVKFSAGGDARQAGSAITYGRRYALCAALNIVADVDDDAEVATQHKPQARESVAIPAELQELLDGGYPEQVIVDIAEVIRVEKGAKGSKIETLDYVARNASKASRQEIVKRIKDSDWSTPKDGSDSGSSDEGEKPEEEAEQAALKVDEPTPA